MVDWAWNVSYLSYHLTILSVSDLGLIMLGQSNICSE